MKRYSPPDPKEEIYKFFQSSQEKTNVILIGSLPNKGIEQIKIHWLFDLIFIGREGFDFKYLDSLMDLLVKFELKPRFELMGFPVKSNSSLVISFFNNKILGSQFWADLVQRIVDRYVDRFGSGEVSKWKFELWNEPDLKHYNILNFTLGEYLNYANGCSKGLKNLKGAVLGGPAGLFRKQNHPLCWGLLEYCSQNSQCPIQFISFHRKGNGTAEGVLNGTLELLDLLHNKFPYFREMPIANDESDIITTWSDSWEWRGDARYAAMVVKVIADHYKSVVLDRKLKIELLSNDNGFLNYHPWYFTQRTLFARYSLLFLLRPAKTECLLIRFQMNRTKPPHDQFIKKPVYVVMGLLSFLEHRYLSEEINSEDPLLTVLATRTSSNNDQSNLAILLAYADSDEINIETIKSVRLRINNLSIGSRFVVYLLDNVRTNPYELWKELGRPVFPDRSARKQLRNREGPYRLFDPTTVTNVSLSVFLNLTLPSIVLLHLCGKPRSSPGPVTKLSIYNVTFNEILLTWSDSSIHTKCIRTYEIEFESKCENSLEFKKVNERDSVFLSYQHVTDRDGACETTIGRYRVRAMDYWDQPGNYSEIVSYS